MELHIRDVSKTYSNGEQHITLMVPKEPARAGIDPHNLLIDVKPDDNLKEIDRA